MLLQRSAREPPVLDLLPSVNSEEVEEAVGGIVAEEFIATSSCVVGKQVSYLDLRNLG